MDESVNDRHGHIVVGKEVSHCRSCAMVSEVPTVDHAKVSIRTRDDLPAQAVGQAHGVFAIGRRADPQ